MQEVWKASQFAKISQSQQVGEKAEESEASEDDNILVKDFDDFDDVEIMFTQTEGSSVRHIEDYIQDGIKNERETMSCGEKDSWVVISLETRGQTIEAIESKSSNWPAKNSLDTGYR